MRIQTILFSVISLVLFSACTNQNTRIESPGSANSIEFFLDEGVPYYAVQHGDSPVITSSRLGFELQDQPALDGGFEISSVEKSSFDETWTQVWGEKEEIRNHYNELKVTLKETEEPNRELSVVFRAYDDGIGFRYEFPDQSNLQEFNIMDELTEFNMTGDHESWWIGALQWNRYEYLPEHTRLAEVDTVVTPFTMKTEDGLYLALHEAALVDYSTMNIEHTGDNQLKANLIPWHDGVLVRASTPFKTPWRTLQIGEQAGDLVESYLTLNLNEPNKIEDTSWIEPAKYVGIWWEMHLDKSTWGSGPIHGATTENAMKYIDFAAEHGFDHVLVEGWNPGWDGDWFADGVVFDFTRPMDDFDLEQVAEYALDNGVRLMGHHETSASVEHYEGQMEEAFQLYEELGVRSVKMGYVGHGQEIFWTDEDGNRNYEWHHGQHMVRHHQKVVELAAKYNISLNVHEGVKDTGLRRTWPNLMTREVARGQEYNAWGSGENVWDGPGNPPNYVTILPFHRNLAGPFDYTPGIVDLLFDEYKPDNRINHTLAKELALYVVIYSPLQMAADLPENYEERSDALQFIKDVPADWHDTKVLNGEIGKYITTVRKDRDSEDWYLGSITDEEPREFTFTLDFLNDGDSYIAQIYRDSEDADWDSNPYGFVVEEMEVDSDTEFTVNLAPGGGQAVRFMHVSE
ncbi:glycoside hydrolase family 97 protein [Rhodohalobacter barkolensis]|uniref:Alpha-glucosidase n=1 Tax=Rhodohalobacter barkolensis TaxID=2053187 RepID=A0A2N0VE88_9BACT|nr:glycoside hydrolase family 97 protein [Rhodohalobacter barkolensis]PKD42515.1 alpha-glucosidase [Rhodohalobacter barkolensis]